MSYVKLFSSILTSSLWGESPNIRIVWITMLAMADKHGEVISTIPGLARLASVSINDVEDAIHKFLSPDPYSRTPDDDGRRIERIDGGWALLNYGKYREQASDEDRKKKTAERVRRHREKNSRNAASTKCNAFDGECNASNDECNDHETPTRHIAEAESYAEAKESSFDGDLSSSSRGDLFDSDFPSLPKNWKRMKQRDLQRIRVSANTEKMNMIGAMLGRRHNTLWTMDEVIALIQVNPSDEEILSLTPYYTASIPKEQDFRRMQVITLLNNWNGELDKARLWASH